MSKNTGFSEKLDASAILTIIGIILLFSTSIIVVLLAPRHLDPTWTEPTNPYMVQMYEVVDPNLYISSAVITGGLSEKQFVYHLKEGFSLISLEENEMLRILAPPDLEKYVTRFNEKKLKLTSHILMLQRPDKDSEYGKKAEEMRQVLQEEWEKNHPKADEEGLQKPNFVLLELYEPGGKDAFAFSPPDSQIENWVDSNFIILDETVKQPFHKDPGVIFLKNPVEYRIKTFKVDNEEEWRFDPRGQKIANLVELKGHRLAFHSRQEFIKEGEHIFAVEGCWYCHTDQTRTLIQDVVLNGAADYPAPPSSANEYIYQDITFPGTRRIGPDISRVGVKRPSRDWHKGHFWSPKTASRGSIMPAFRHFFDKDPQGTSQLLPGIPNFQFEAIFQYLMTKGTRITPPTQAWWLGKDPIQTLEIIEGKKTLPK